MKILSGKWVALVTLLAVATSSARGQTGGSAHGSLELGFRSFTDQPAPAERAGFLMYRDVSRGFFVQQAALMWNSFDNRSFAFVQGNELGEKDQSVKLNVSRPGSYRFDASWGQLPHTFSTTARLPGIETEPGVFTLPTPRPDTASLKQLPMRTVATRWDPLQLSLGLTPRRDLGFEVAYQRVEKSGGRPISTGFGQTNYREVPEPIDQTTHSLRISQSLARPKYQLQLAYDLSRFENHVSALVVDNPLSIADAINAPARGRVALAPDNTAHTFSLVSGVNLPGRTRVNAAVNYSMRYQEDALLPFTINSALNTQALGSVPADLAGDVRTTMFNTTITNRSLPNIGITARYRYFEYDDQTPDLHLAGRVSMDRSVSTTALERERFPFEKQNAGLDVSWRPLRLTQLQAGYGWERWGRHEHRNVLRSDEHSWRAALAFTPDAWFSLRTSVVQAERRADDYQQVTSIQNPLQRRFDQADRDRARVEVRAELFPIDVLTIGATVSSGTDEYPDARIGLQADKARAYGVDAAWSPWPEASLSAGYTLETFKNRLRSRYRTPAQLDNPTFDWVSNNEDEITTLFLAGELNVGRFDVGVNVERSKAWLDMSTFNPVPPAGGTASENTSATAVDFPRIRQEIMPVSAHVRFTPRPQWSLGLRYTYEEYENTDWRTDGLTPVDGVHVLLGNDLLDYKASYFSFTITYRPQLRRSAAAL